MNISFIIPVFNEEKYISKCLDALVPQIEKGDQVIVVDNNSTDKTSQRASKFDCVIVKEKKQGISHARNAGAKIAKNNYIAFLDVDGLVSKNYVKNLKNEIKDFDISVGINIFSNQNFGKFLLYNIYTFFVYFFGVFPLQIIGKTYIVPNNFVIKKSLFNELGGFEPVIGEDYWLSKKLWEKSYKGSIGFGMIVYYSSRGFEKRGFVKTILGWIKHGFKRSSQEKYSYRSRKMACQKIGLVLI